MRAQAPGALVTLVLLLSACSGSQGNTDDAAGGTPSLDAEAVKAQADKAAAEVLPGLVEALDADLTRMEARFDSCSAGKRYQAAAQLRAPSGAVDDEAGTAAVADLLEESGWAVETDESDAGGVRGTRGEVSLSLSDATEKQAEQELSVRSLSIETSCRIYPDGDALEDIAATDYADLVAG